MYWLRKIINYSHDIVIYIFQTSSLTFYVRVVVHVWRVARSDINEKEQRDVLIVIRQNLFGFFYLIFKIIHIIVCVFWFPIKFLKIILCPKIGSLESI